MGLIRDFAREWVRSIVNVEVRSESKQDYGSSVGRVNSTGSAMYNASTGAGLAGSDIGASQEMNFNRINLYEEEALQLYRFGGLPRRIIDIVPTYGTRVGWTVDTPDETGIMNDFDRDLDVYEVIKDAWRFALRDGGACVLMVTSERGNAKLSEPLDPRNLIRIERLQVYERAEIVLSGRICTDASSANYRRPETITLTPRMLGMARTEVVHHSRFLWIYGHDAGSEVRADNAGWDDSYFDVILDSIKRREAVSSAAATNATRMITPYMKVADIRGKTAAESAELWIEAVKNMMRLVSNNRGVVSGTDDSFELHSASLSGFKDLDEASRANLSADTGFPLTILYGETPGGLNTDGASGKNAFDTRISAAQNSNIRRPLRKMYDLVFQSIAGPTMGTVPDGWTLMFNPLGIPSALEEAQKRLIIAQKDEIYERMDVISRRDIQASRFSGEHSDEMINVEPIEDLGPDLDEV